MQISYNLIGAKRKELVSAVNQELNAPVKYLGMPTAAYKVGGYIIDKNGTLTGEYNPGLVADLQGLHGFIAVTEEYDTPLVCEASIGFEDLQMDGREELGLGQTRCEECQGENGMQASNVPDIDQHYPGQYADPSIPMSAEMIEQIEDYYANNPLCGEEHDCLTIEMPRSAFTETELENLTRLINSKASLIKKALGTDSIPIFVGKYIISFPWFKCEYTTDEVKAYTHFVAALCEMAKKLNRVTASDKPVDSEKFAFRCFLLRLGFIGPQFKTERKILLSRLTGNSSKK